MTIDRAERTGFGVAAAGHVLLFGVLSAGWFASPPPLQLKRQPVEVELVDETGLESGAPEISTEAPAAKRAEVEGPIEAAPPMPLPEPQPVPVPAPPKAAPAPAPAPKPAKQPSPKAAPAPPKAAAKPAPKAAAARGRLEGLLEGISDRPSQSRSTTPTAATITPAAQAALAAAVRRQIKPHWSGPTGAGVEELRTILEIELARDGSVSDVRWVDTTGVNATNRPQAQLHRERAIKAVRLASPFQLPPQFYDGWKSMKVTFDWKLSQ